MSAQSIPVGAPRGGPAPRLVLEAAAWLLGGAAALRLVDGFFADNPAAAAVLGALLVDLLAGRAGVRWSVEAKTPWWPLGRRSLLVGLCLGLALVALGHAAGWATLSVGAPHLAVGFAALRLLGVAVRDELLLRVLPVTLGRRAGLPDGALVGFCAVAAAAPLVGAGAGGAAVAVAAAQGLLGARLAIATGSAVAPVAAHAGLSLALGPLSRGGLLETRWWLGDPGPAPLAEGPIGWIAAATIAIAAMAVPRWSERRLPPGD